MLRYIYNEFKYGSNLYITTWKQLLFHPWQTTKNIVKAICHPVKTGQALVREIKKHPIGMAINIGLNWITGRVISEGIESLVSSCESTTMHLSSPTFNTPMPYSTVLQTAQCAGGCGCAGICATATATTTAGQITAINRHVKDYSTSTNDNSSIKGKCCYDDVCSTIKSPKNNVHIYESL